MRIVVQYMHLISFVLIKSFEPWNFTLPVFPSAQYKVNLDTVNKLMREYVMTKHAVEQKGRVINLGIWNISASAPFPCVTSWLW